MRNIHKHPLINSFLYWCVYFDDIIDCFSGTNRQLDSSVKSTNTIHPKVQFTMEFDKDNKDNFLHSTLNK